MTRQLRDRRDDQTAFVLHTYPYRETSLIVEMFTATYGRVAMVARGAKRPRSELRGLLCVPAAACVVGGRGRAQNAAHRRLARRHAAAAGRSAALRLLSERI